jgi:hypothetical protein
MPESDCYFSVSPDDVITRVSAPLQRQLGRFAGHSIWTRLPGSQAVLRPYFEEARESGRDVEFVAFYAGATMRVRIVPAGRSLTVYPTRLSELDVRTLATLRSSLERIVSELGARELSRLGRRARASLQALP